MKIEDLKKIQENGISSEERVKSIVILVSLYNEKCKEFTSRNNLFLHDVLLQDVFSFFEETGLKYSNPTDPCFVIKGADIELTVNNENLQIRDKGKDRYLSFSLTLTNYEVGDFVCGYINYKGQRITLSNLSRLMEVLNKTSLADLQEIRDTLSKYMIDVNKALENLLSIGTDYSKFTKEYYDVEDTNTKYNSIKEIIENEL